MTFRARVSQRIVVVYALLAAANIGAWTWALIAFRGYPLLVGTSLLAYGLGLRHALDADHIAAIDNVTRRLMHTGESAVSVGLYFSLGHSTVVVIASIAIAATTVSLNTRFAAYRTIGGTIGTIVSAVFLLVIALMNTFILIAVYRAFQNARAGRVIHGQSNDELVGGKILARIFRPFFLLISRSWHMYPLGFLFGLGFDTATEIGLLGISAAQASKGMPIWSILVFPALFTAGMSLVDTTDSVLMLGAYGWAFTHPVRKLYYNLTITAVSVVIAVLIGSIEALGLLAEKLSLDGPFWRGISFLNSNFGSLGYLIILVFAVSWVFAAVIYRMKGFDALEVVENG